MKLQPAALQTELHTLLERNKETQSCGLAPLIEAIGVLLHVRGSFGHRHAAGVVAGSNYQNTMVQLAAYFEESMAALTSARIAELVDAEVFIGIPSLASLEFISGRSRLHISRSRR